MIKRLKAFNIKYKSTNAVMCGFSWKRARAFNGFKIMLGFCFIHWLRQHVSLFSSVFFFSFSFGFPLETMHQVKLR